jgi:hypothetical protein
MGIGRVIAETVEIEKGYSRPSHLLVPGPPYESPMQIASGEPTVQASPPKGSSVD